ncbi:MAG: hypothetical protein II695_00235 [Oscillospiraceae bacterium]|nr:hypothetical protein [Oscillospiraceae bacterium]
MKNNAFDAYRIYTGHRFSRSLLSSLLIVFGLTAVFTLIWTVRDTISVITNGLSLDDWLDWISTNNIMLALDFMWFFGLITVVPKRLVNLDMCDKLAPGGKFFCTLPDSRNSLKRAHILMTAECVIMVFILCTINTVTLTILSVTKWGVAPSEMIFGEILYSLGLISRLALFPLAAANLCELMPRRIQRLVLTFLAMLFTSLSVSAYLYDMQDVPIFFVGAVLLPVSEYILLKKQDARIADEPAAA